MNDENAYNLIDEPWIPVLMRDGTNRSVSLGEVFADTDGTIADLALNPYERVAVFRLLLCIAQAALGPERLKDERAWRTAKSSVGPVSEDYVEKWHDRFFLYGPHAFLQPDDVVAIRDDALTSCDKLVFRLASGNNSTLFDHEAVGSNSRVLSDQTLALGLLTYQSFSSGGLSGMCLWSGTATDRSIKGAPCRESSMLFSILLGESLLETVWLNLLTAKSVSDLPNSKWGEPVWKLDALSRSSAAELAKTFLGHLVPLSRAVKLTRGSPLCILGGGVAYPDLSEWRESMASVKLKQDGSHGYVSSDPARMPWRDLASILAVKGSGGRKAALALTHLESLPEEKEFVLWTGGLHSEKAKEINTVEWKKRLSVSMLEESAMEQYENAVVLADQQSKHLASAVNEYSETLKMSTVKRGNIEVYGLTIPAKKVYWDILAQPENQNLVLAQGSDTYLPDWKKACLKAAEDAYRRACPAMTARQMEAFAQGFSQLNIREEN